MIIEFDSWGIEFDSVPLYFSINWSLLLIGGAIYFGWGLFKEVRKDWRVKKAARKSVAGDYDA